jgi:hypothetical protein
MAVIDVPITGTPLTRLADPTWMTWLDQATDPAMFGLWQ